MLASLLKGYFLNEEIKLSLGMDNENIKWISDNNKIAIVNNGTVKGLSEATVVISAYLEEELLFSFNVLVL